jgi:hypothetical protein
MQFDCAGLPEELGQHILTDCTGLCYPAMPGNTVDMLFGLSALARGDRFKQQLSVAFESMNPAESQLAQRIINTLERLPADSRARLFANPLAETDTTAAVQPHDLNDTREMRRTLSGVRHLIHHPDLHNITFVLPPSLFMEGHLYLPHAHALLGRGPPDVTVAVVMDGDNSRFVWSDGLSLTLANRGGRLPPGFNHPRLTALPFIGSFPVLNEVAEVAPFLVSFGPATNDEASLAAHRFEAALELLNEIWPVAYHALTRHAKALCILTQRSYSRSHSPPELPGTILMSLDDVGCIGDLLCHESSHIRMNVFRLYDPIAKVSKPELEAAGFVSPWRPDLRPLRGLVDGVHAFLNVCHYHRRLQARFPGSSASGVIYQRQKRNIIQANQTLREQAMPTRLGAMLLNEFAREEALL